MEMLVFAGAAVVKITIVMVTVLITVAILTLAERKILSWMQDRMGPMEVGPYGILQPLADGIKLFFKEDLVPAGANRLLFSLAPILSLVPALIGFAVVPYGPNREIELFGVTIKPFIITDINIGILYILAFTSIGAYGIILGGWASNNKYSLLGGLRAAAQVISYELNVGLAIISVLILSRSLSMVTIAEKQTGSILNWNVIGMGHGNGIWWWFPVTQFVAFVVYVISSVAETNRLPFDLPEAESELVAGWMTEYSGMRFAFFFMSEYSKMILVSCLASVLFVGVHRSNCATEAQGHHPAIPAREAGLARHLPRHDRPASLRRRHGQVRRLRPLRGRLPIPRHHGHQQRGRRRADEALRQGILHGHDPLPVLRPVRAGVPGGRAGDDQGVRVGQVQQARPVPQ